MIDNEKLVAALRRVGLVADPHLTASLETSYRDLRVQIDLLAAAETRVDDRRPSA
ncbi:MAG: hypothetical protein ACRDZ2_14825 [Ilumatobacteraceae bacterium]